MFDKRLFSQMESQQPKFDTAPFCNERAKAQGFLFKFNLLRPFFPTILSFLLKETSDLTFTVQTKGEEPSQKPMMFNVNFSNRKNPLFLGFFFLVFLIFSNPLSIEAQIRAQPNLISGVAATCQGDTVIWSVPDGYRSVKWSRGDTTRSIKLGASGSYSVVYVSATGDSSTETKTLTVNPRPLVGIVGVPFVCNGRSTELRAEGNFVSIAWSNNRNTRVTLAGAVGTYTATVTDNNGCTNSTSIEVRDGSKPYNALLDTVKICEGDTAVLDASTPFARSYYWAIETEDTTASIIVRDTGRYSVIVSSGECVSYDTVYVLKLPRPTVNLGVDTSICLGDTLVLRAETNPLYTYLWSTGAKTPQIRVADSGSYHLDISFGSCQFGDTILIDIFNKQRSRNVLDTAVCTPQFDIVPMQLGARMYQWNTQTATTFSVSEPGTYNILAYNKKCFVELKYKIAFKKLPEINFPNDTTLCRDAGGNALFLSAGKMNSARFRWQNDDTLPTFNITQSGQYFVTAENECGEASDSVNVIVKNCNALFLPNVFSPNGDGLNETFKISPSDDVAKIKRFSIFDRWGNLVFTAAEFSVDDIERNSWDGSFKGRTVGSGDVFVYFVEYVTRLGVDYITKGDVTVMR